MLSKAVCGELGRSLSLCGKKDFLGSTKRVAELQKFVASKIPALRPIVLHA
jgi:hypothetical protein